MTLADWACDNLAERWPPPEPAGIDRIAKTHRIGSYQRALSLDDIKRIMVGNNPVALSLDVTDEWLDAPGGAIPENDDPSLITGVHAIQVWGYDDRSQQIQFLNSWGKGWGDSGFGTISYEYYRRWAREAWTYQTGDTTTPLAYAHDRLEHLHRGIVDLAWGIPGLTGGVFHCREVFDKDNNERMGWVFLVERGELLDIEDFYVRPAYRRRGYASRLVASVLELSKSLARPLRMFVAHADCYPDNRPGLDKILLALGLSLRNTDERFAAYVALPGPSPRPLEPITFPDRPALSRMSRLAALAASTMALGLVGVDSNNLDDSPIIDLVTREIPPPTPMVTEQLEHFDSDIEHDIDFSAFPFETIGCRAKIVLVEEGRCDLPLSDDEWDAIHYQED